MDKRNLLIRTAGILVLLAFVLVIGHVVFGHSCSETVDLSKSTSDACSICHFAFGLAAVFVTLLYLTVLVLLFAVAVSVSHRVQSLLCSHISVRAPPY